MPWLRWLRHPAVPRYALAVAVMVAAMTLTVAAEPVVRRLPTAPVFAAILVVTWLVGLGPGILATALAVAVLDYLTDAPPYRLHLDNRDLGWMVLFSSTVLVSAWLASLVRRLQGERERALVREREARMEAERATRAKEVTLEATRQGDRIRVVVRDTGEGISPAMLSQIFDPFRQGEPGLRRRDGLGLGLAITRHIVESHGGTISAESAGRGRGAAFIIELPAAA